MVGPPGAALQQARRSYVLPHQYGKQIILKVNPRPEIELSIPNLAGIDHGMPIQHIAQSLQRTKWLFYFCASKEQLVRSLMDTVQQIAFSFTYSAQWLRVFQAGPDLDEDAQVGMNKDAQACMNSMTNLQSLYEIKWSCLANALYAFKPAFSAVVTTLEYLEEEWDGKPRRYLLSIKNVDFIMNY